MQIPTRVLLSLDIRPLSFMTLSGDALSRLRWWFPIETHSIFSMMLLAHITLYLHGFTLYSSLQHLMHLWHLFWIWFLVDNVFADSKQCCERASVLFVLVSIYLWVLPVDFGVQFNKSSVFALCGILQSSFWQFSLLVVSFSYFVEAVDFVFCYWLLVFKIGDVFSALGQLLLIGKILCSVHLLLLLWHGQLGLYPFALDGHVRQLVQQSFVVFLQAVNIKFQCTDLLTVVVCFFPCKFDIILKLGKSCAIHPS